MAQLAFSIGLYMEPITCYLKDCGITFAVPAQWDSNRRSDQQSFWCPNGHRQSYQGKSAEQLLKERIERAGNTERLLRDQLNGTERRLVGQRAATSRLRNKLERTNARVARGVCPCCNRTFSKLARHMETKHPGFASENVELKAVERAG